MSAILELRGLTVRFGGLTAVDKVDIAVEPGRIFSIIGPNGAGKTTVFNAITGVYDPTEGDVLFEGRPLERPFTAGVGLRIALVGAVMALLALGMVWIEPLWRATVVANYRYRQPFPWGKATLDLFAWLGAHALQAGVTAAAGLALGALGTFVVWRRQRRTPNVVAGRGICRTFQNIRLFPDMTVLENILLGMDGHLRSRLWHMALRLPFLKREEAAAAQEALELLRFVGLESRAGDLAKTLAYGEQRRLEIARALGTRPRLVLLDEPGAGMNPSETGDLMALIRSIRDRGVTVLLIEHHMKVVMGISDRIAVLNYGSKIAEGSPEEVRADPKVIEAYLGKEEVS